MLVFVLLAGGAAAAGADGNTSTAPHTLDVRIAPDNKPVSGIEVQLHRVADVHVGCEEPMHSLSYTLTEAFKGSGADVSGDITSPALASALYDYAIDSKNNIPAEESGDYHSGVTGPDGIVRFSNLEEGLYLISQIHPADADFEAYVFSPFLMGIPCRNEELGGGLGYGVICSPKTETINKPVRVEAVKVWKGVAADICSPVEVQLTCRKADGSRKILNATLGKDNDWKKLFDGFYSEDITWTLTEKVPDGFSASYSGPVVSATDDGVKLLTFTVTNTAEKPPILIQTGHQNWCIPVLVILGLALIAAGCVIIRHGKKEEA